MKTAMALAVSCCLLAASAVVRADECAPVVRDAWVRMPPMQMPMMAGFGRIENPCAAPVVVIGARSDAFESVEVHQTSVVDGVSRMRHVPELRIDAGSTAELKPGGLHLMLMRPRATLKAGDAVDVELELDDGRKLRGDFEVRRPN